MPFRSLRDRKRPLSTHPLVLRGLHRALSVVSVLLLSAGPIPFASGALATQRAEADQHASCHFEAGFAELRDLIGAATVGDCVEHEHFRQRNGDTLQTTTRGLLMWNKADNWTAFTDGTTTWIN